MSANEELEEHVHHAQDPFTKVVAGSMAIIAALLAVVSVSGQHFTTEQLLMQQQASDQWAYYQAKDIRRYAAQVAHDTLGELNRDARASGRYAQDADKYKKQAGEIQEKARELERDRDKNGREALRFHFGEVFLEIAIVLSSLSILLKRRSLFTGAVASALIGVAISITGWTA